VADERAFFSVLVSWLMAQLIKFVLAKVKSGDFFSGRALKTGGMPSAHAALVGSLCFCAGIFNGTTSIEFLTTLVLAGIVSYDAMHMRAEFHRQGLLLKEVAVKTLGKEYVDKRCPNMNEFQGHEMVEVVAGLALGVVVSAIVLNL